MGRAFLYLRSKIKALWTIYSATTFLEKCRKVVLEKWFCKLGFFFWSTTFLQPEKRWIYGIKPPFFLVNHFSRTRFLEPLFSNHFSTLFQKSGCRLNGRMRPALCFVGLLVGYPYHQNFQGFFLPKCRGKIHLFLSPLKLMSSGVSTFQN